jgi:cysteinyl-tRNA synthetase, unknown class
MRQRPDGGSKLVISYMSIGEAEDYRYYWNAAWAKKKSKPAWLDDLNPDWEGNFKVRYWDPAWQAVILGSPNAYLDKIIAAGFDGVYLDIIDAFEYWKDDKGERDTADQDMIAFVQMISQYARAQRPGFMIIPQNGEALLADAGYRAAISAQAKEDVFYGGDGDGKPNKSADVSDVLDNLKYARDAGIPILAIEYLDDTKKITDAKDRLEQNGCCTYFGPRDLASISLKGIQST